MLLVGEGGFRRFGLSGDQPRNRINFARVSARIFVWALFAFFCAARAAIERHLMRFSRFGGKNPAFFYGACSNYFSRSAKENRSLCAVWWADSSSSLSRIAPRQSRRTSGRARDDRAKLDNVGSVVLVGGLIVVAVAHRAAAESTNERPRTRRLCREPGDHDSLLLGLGSKTLARHVHATHAKKNIDTISPDPYIA